MRLLLGVTLALLAVGCAQRYLRVTAASLLECDRPLDVSEHRDGWVVRGCGRTTVCNRHWTTGTLDEWECQNVSDAGAYDWR